MMARRLGMLLLVVVLLSVSVAPPRPAQAASVGQNNTTNITIGAAVIYELFRFMIDNGHTNGSVSQASAVITSYPDKTRALLIERAKVMYYAATYIASPIGVNDTNGAAHQAHRDQMRRYFEDLRACWNQSIANPAPASGTGNGNTTPPAGTTPQKTSNAGVRQIADAGIVVADVLMAQNGTTVPPPTTQNPPAGGTTPTAPSCDGVIKNDLKTLPTSIDSLDLGSALTDESVFQQVLDQKVGSFDTTNFLRASLLATAAENFAAYSNDTAASAAPTQTGAGGVQLSDIQSLAADCVTKASPTQCLTDLDGVEQKVAAARTQAAACTFARKSWMPTFTAITRAWTTKANNLPGATGPAPAPAFDPSTMLAPIDSVDFGAAPGC